MRKKICPQCKKSNIQFFAGGITGNYSCKCGYVGPIIIEIEKIKIKRRNTPTKKRKLR